MSAAGGMSPLERVLAALSFKEPDRVPFFLLLTTHGARELGLSIRDYFADPEAVAEGQLRMRARYGHDCLYGFTHAAIEVEAFGGSAVYVEDGPPNAGAPPFPDKASIAAVRLPELADCPSLQGNLRAVRTMRARAGAGVPIIGVAMSPFSLPAMQLGLPLYLELLQEDEAALGPLWEANSAFCAAWSNAQLEAGATAICYFDPMASPDMVPLDLYRRLGKPLARRTIAAIKGPTATHLASGRGLAVLPDLAETGTAVFGLSASDSLAEAKRLAAGRLTVIGNLNALAMRNWSAERTDRAVRETIAAGAPGGGFILADNHGEIPWAVPESTLDDLAEAVRRHGTYPIRL